MKIITIYGLEKPEAKKVEAEINRLLRGEPYADDYVVLSIRSSARDRHHRRKPFLHLISTPDGEKHDNEILTLLQKIGLGIAVPYGMRYFIPAAD